MPSSKALLRPDVQAQIAAEVRQRMRPTPSSLLPGEAALELDMLVKKSIETVVLNTIDIPRISVVPRGEVTAGFRPFTLELSGLYLQPTQREIVGQNLRTNEQFTLEAESATHEARLEDYIVYALVDYDAHAELLYELVGQAVAHLQTYLSESEARNFLSSRRRTIAQMIHAQMAEHFWERVTEYDVKVSRGFTELKNCAFTYLPENERDVRDTVEDLGRIRQLVFGGFARCLYRLQKFDSGTERRVALILDRDTQRWFRPVRGQFQIYYKLRAEQPEYVPDFVAETDEELLMIEAKARDEMTTPEVLAKATAATAWCSHATRYNAENNGKPWRYLLIPHDQVSEAARPVDLRRFEFASMADD